MTKPVAEAVAAGRARTKAAMRASTRDRCRSGTGAVYGRGFGSAAHRPKPISQLAKLHVVLAEARTDVQLHLIEPLLKLVERAGDAPQLNECAHDLDVHGDGPIATKNAGEHCHAEPVARELAFRRRRDRPDPRPASPAGRGRPESASRSPGSRWSAALRLLLPNRPWHQR